MDIKTSWRKPDVRYIRKPCIREKQLPTFYPTDACITTNKGEKKLIESNYFKALSVRENKEWVENAESEREAGIPVPAEPHHGEYIYI